MAHRNAWLRIEGSIEKRKAEIMEIGRWIYAHPETGYREFQTAAYTAERLESLGWPVERLDDLPAVRCVIDTGRPGPTIAILGEMDALLCPEHPDSDKKTGAIHACGHDAQVAAMLGAVMGLKDAGVLGKLSGKILCIAVPAEEYIEVAYRMALREQGRIRYLGGKPELLHRGFFGDTGLCIKIHAGSGEKKAGTGVATQNGCLVKQIRYIGKATHAGGSPHAGINALYAANLGLSAINAIRETFREADFIRVHPIMTRGGEAVNVIPAEVEIETYIRGKTLEAILKTNAKVDRALAGGAISLGAAVEVTDIPGYMPGNYDLALKDLSREILVALTGSEDQVNDTRGHGTASSDMGDLSSMMPVIEASIGGVKNGHGVDYQVTDPDNLYITGARYLACLAYSLLADEATQVRRIIGEYKPLYPDKEAYFAALDRLFRKVTYSEKDLTRLP